MCGEKALSTFSSRKNSGSPPRMRGKVQPDADGCRPPRITPAYAGKRMLYARAVRRDRDHPRVCGEKTAPRHRLHLAKGSPPRMRGKGCYMQELSGETGITLAYAGKSRVAALRLTLHRDHPRVCGEKPAVAVLFSKTMGSPPRMRGKVVGVVVIHQRQGITPACAGKRYVGTSRFGTSGDHPRVCGEKPTQTAPTPASPISSMARWVTRVPGPSSSTEMPAAGI